MHIDTFSIELHTFLKYTISFPIIPMVKMAKIWVLLVILAHIERQPVFSIAMLCYNTVDIVV